MDTLTLNRIQFDTSAFLPDRRRRGYQPNHWQRFTLVMDEPTKERVFARLDQLDEEANRTGRSAALRAYSRQIVKRYAR